jgi:hypothetical protein
MFARNRTQEDLAHDPHLIFNVGRLVGACEMTSQYLALHGDENSKGMGAALAQEDARAQRGGDGGESASVGGAREELTHGAASTPGARRLLAGRDAPEPLP